MFILIVFIFTTFICQAAHFQGESITYKVINTTIRLRQDVIFIPTINADNDQVRCRFSLNGSNKCADVCPPASLPNGTILLSNFTLFITGANVNDWYAVAIIIEDLINSTSITLLSSIPVGQTYVIELIAANFCPNSTIIKDIATLSFPIVIKTRQHYGRYL